MQRGCGDLLLELLADRFGELPGEVVDRVRAAEVLTLRIWSRVALSSPDLDGVFGRPE